MNSISPKRKDIIIVSRWFYKTGGTERCVTELIEKLQYEYDITLLCGVNVDTQIYKVKFIKVPSIGQYNIFSFLSFFISATLIVQYLKYIKRIKYDLIFSAGPDVMYPDIIQSHFCEAKRLHLYRTKQIKLETNTFKLFLRKLHRFLLSIVVSKIEGIVYRKVKRIIAVSKQLKNDLIEYYKCNSDKIDVVYNGFDAREFSDANKSIFREKVRKELNILPNELMLLFVGGDWERKGLRIVLKSFCLLDIENIKFVIIGNGEKNAYKDLLSLNKKSNSIIFLKSTSQIKEYYSAADIFIFPSLYDPFGLTLLEAIASGIPVIVSKYAGVSELLINKIDSFIIDPYNDTEIKETIIELSKNNMLRQQIREKSQSLISKYAWDRNINEIITIFKEYTA